MVDPHHLAQLGRPASGLLQAQARQQRGGGGLGQHRAGAGGDLLRQLRPGLARQEQRIELAPVQPGRAVPLLGESLDAVSVSFGLAVLATVALGRRMPVRR